MNPFATIPIEPQYADFHKRYPALDLIGNTRMIEILCFREEFPEVKVYAKAEYTNPGGSLKDRPVRRMLLEALIAGKIGKMIQGRNKLPPTQIAGASEDYECEWVLKLVGHNLIPPAVSSTFICYSMPYESICDDSDRAAVR